MIGGLRHIIGVVLASISLVTTTEYVEAGTIPSVPNCEGMAAEVGLRAGLPAGYLPAISRIEAGRQVDNTRKAWPWTLNHSGKGLYFETRAEALAYLRKATEKGRTNIDVGCMQINHYWHGHQFASLEQMMEPARNIEYAASFLKELYSRHGSWVEAVKHYHSPDDARGARYFKGFEDAHRSVKDTQPVAATQVASGDFFTLAGQQRKFAPLANGREPLLMGAERSQSLGADQVYDRLLAALGPELQLDRFSVWQAKVPLAKRQQTRGVVRQKWGAIETFRAELSARKD
jgi:hypothetical protein